MIGIREYRYGVFWVNRKLRDLEWIMMLIDKLELLQSQIVRGCLGQVEDFSFMESYGLCRSLVCEGVRVYYENMRDGLDEVGQGVGGFVVEDEVKKRRKK